MTTTKEAPPCPSCGSVACYVQNDNFCRHTRELRPSFSQTQLVGEGFELYVLEEDDRSSALVRENQAAKPLRNADGRAFCQYSEIGIRCSLFMGHDKGEDQTLHAFLGPEDDDREEDEKEDDDSDGDTSEDGRLRDQKGVGNAPNKQVTESKPKQRVTTK